MKKCGNGGRAQIFLIFTPDGGEWSTSCPWCFTPSTHWIGGWADPRASLNTVYLAPPGNQTLAIQPIAHHYTMLSQLFLIYFQYKVWKYIVTLVVPFRRG
jgi:hypothetical protein